MSEVEAPLSLAELRRALRALPRERRRALARAIRNGRAVEDPRDAALAVRWARRVQAAYWPRWMLPQSRPRGRRGVLWSAHAVWLLAALALVLASMWSRLGFLRWALLASVLYLTLGAPFTIASMLRMRWNAPEAERRNRALLDETHD